MSIRMTVEEKGVFVENIVANMFIGSGRKVFHNGIEKTNTDFYNRFNERKRCKDKMDYDPRLRQLMSKPDMIIECVNGEYDFAEVKFRSINHKAMKSSVGWLINDINLRKHFKALGELWRPEIILVTDSVMNTGNFTVLSYPYIEETDNVLRVIHQPIAAVKKWGIRRSIIELNEEIIKKTFL